MVDEAIGFLEDMISGKFQPNIVSYKIVLPRLCKAYRINDVIEVLITMIENGC
jgi:pentatricopeptide repeat protein